MAVSAGPEIIEDGLLFYYDFNNEEKSWKGKPTTNYAYSRNARIDDTYAPYSATSSGTWNAKHPDAITVYNDAGGNISVYVNSGVSDWTNTYHAIWTLDPILKRPVVTMRDVDGNWKAKNFYMNVSMTDMGLGAGDTYSISWLQWTSDITKSARSGLYGKNTSGTNGFHDGQSHTQGASFNTLPYTWQRVYATFTVNAVRDMAEGVYCYMYGHLGVRGELRVTDVQIEPGTPSGFTKSLTRPSTESVLDLTSNNTATVVSLDYLSDNSVNFNTNGSVINVPVSGLSSSAVTVEAVVKVDAHGAWNRYVNNSWVTNGWLLYSNGSSWYFGVGNASGSQFNTTYAHGGTTDWTHLTGVYDGSTVRLYVNGVQRATNSLTTTTLLTSNQLNIGGSVASGVTEKNIDYVRIYNRGLSAEEVAQNFNATRSRYGL